MLFRSSGFEAAVAAALGSLADSLVVQDLNAAVTAISALRNENLGQAEIFVSNSQGSATTLPAGLTPLLNHVSGPQISALLSHLLGNVVVVEDARSAAELLAKHPQITVVTKSGDNLTATRVRGGSKNSSSLIEIQSLIEQLSEELVSANHECERLGFEIQNAKQTLQSRQSEYDQALSRLNDSDARISALTEQLAIAGQNIKSANAEVERLDIAITEASNERVADERELEIAQSQLGQHGEIPEPDRKSTRLNSSH